MHSTKGHAPAAASSSKLQIRVAKKFEGGDDHFTAALTGLPDGTIVHADRAHDTATIFTDRSIGFIIDSFENYLFSVNVEKSAEGFVLNLESLGEFVFSSAENHVTITADEFCAHPDSHYMVTPDSNGTYFDKLHRVHGNKVTYETGSRFTREGAVLMGKFTIHCGEAGAHAGAGGHVKVAGEAVLSPLGAPVWFRGDGQNITLTLDLDNIRREDVYSALQTAVKSPVTIVLSGKLLKRSGELTAEEIHILIYEMAKFVSRILPGSVDGEVGAHAGAGGPVGVPTEAILPKSSQGGRRRAHAKSKSRSKSQRKLGSRSRSTCRARRGHFAKCRK